MKTLAALALLAATTLPALAGPWAYEQYDIEGEMDGNSAYQYEDRLEDYILAYDCDALYGFESVYLQTPEPYDEAGSYPPAVPTVFTIDGKDYETSGALENRDGYIFVFYDVLSDDQVGEVFVAIKQAKGPIEVSVSEMKLSFSAEGVSDAIEQAITACGF